MINKKPLILFSLILIILDLVIKILVINYLSYTLNSGIALDILQDQHILTLALNFLGIILVSYFIIENTDKNNTLPLVLIFAGGTANFFDRILHAGYVVDYISLVRYLPTFNLADIYVVGGFIWLMFNYLQKYFHDRKKI